MLLKVQSCFVGNILIVTALMWCMMVAQSCTGEDKELFPVDVSPKGAILSVLFSSETDKPPVGAYCELVFQRPVRDSLQLLSGTKSIRCKWVSSEELVVELGRETTFVPTIFTFSPVWKVIGLFPSSAIPRNQQLSSSVL